LYTGNIRTVRAFGCEDVETKAYLTATGNALQKGNMDAYASAGTYAITNYFDLGCTVLLLWYGGRLVMHDEGLSVGKLITFQLYWVCV
jgi:ABC-type bacteriocin/lantibiotic exporter with double-glycine peptidase domain